MFHMIVINILYHSGHDLSPSFDSPPYRPASTPPTLADGQYHNTAIPTSPIGFSTPSTPRQLSPVGIVDRQCYLDPESDFFEENRYQLPQVYKQVLRLRRLLGLRRGKVRDVKELIKTLHKSINDELALRPGKERWDPYTHQFIRLTYCFNPLTI